MDETRGGNPTWVILFAFEALASFFSITNFLAPESKRDFLWSEAVLLSVAIIACALSVFFERREAVRTGGSCPKEVWEHFQIWVLAAAIGLVGLIIA